VGGPGEAHGTDGGCRALQLKRKRTWGEDEAAGASAAAGVGAGAGAGAEGRGEVGCGAAGASEGAALEVGLTGLEKARVIWDMHRGQNLWPPSGARGRQSVAPLSLFHSLCLPPTLSPLSPLSLSLHPHPSSHAPAPRVCSRRQNSKLEVEQWVAPHVCLSQHSLLLCPPFVPHSADAAPCSLCSLSPSPLIFVSPLHWALFPAPCRAVPKKILDLMGVSGLHPGGRPPATCRRVQALLRSTVTGLACTVYTEPRQRSQHTVQCSILTPSLFPHPGKEKGESKSCCSLCSAWTKLSCSLRLCLCFAPAS